jgi:hypothetical protein
VPSPRNIPKTKAALDPIAVDKLWVKYYTEDKAYALIQDFFMKHVEYTHLVLCADDLVVNKEHFDALAHTLRSDPDKYQVLSGVCNTDMTGGNEYTLAVSKRFPPCNPRRHTGSYGYGFIDMRGHNMQRKDPSCREPPPTGVQQVSFSGFPCMFIARPILERLTLRTDYEFNLQYRLPGSSVDTVFCWEAWQNKIDIYADFDVKMLHLRGWDDPCMKLLVGIENPHTWLQKADGYTKEIQTEPLIVPKQGK